MLGEPESVLASGQLATPDLNGQISAILTHSGGSQASPHTTILSDTPCAAVIAGDEATMTIPGIFYAPGPFTVSFHDGSSLRYDEAAGGQEGGLHFSATDAARVIDAGNLESELHRPSVATATLTTMDEIRRQLDIVFPGD